MQTVLQARRRQMQGVKSVSAATLPVTKDEVRAHQLDQRGSVLGRMWADGAITDQELAAGTDYCARYLAYARLHGLPTPNVSTLALGEARGRSTREERPKAARRAAEEHHRDRVILRITGIIGVGWSMDRACVQDEEAPLELVKAGLNALVAAGR